MAQVTGAEQHTKRPGSLTVETNNHGAGYGARSTI
jgi:hypothetical protein